MFSAAIIWGGLGIAASKKPSLINWYEPEFLMAQDDVAEIRLSGETLPRAIVSVDLSKIISISGGTAKRRPVKSEIRSAISDEKGSFELVISVAYGILQVPVQVQVATEPQQNLLVIFEVASNTVKVNAKTIKKVKVKVVKGLQSEEVLEEAKPKAERARVKSEVGDTNFDISLGVAYPSHRYAQKINLESDVSFQSGNAPSLNLMGGGKLGSFGFDLGYNSSSGSIASAAEPFVIKKGDYKWQNLNLMFSYLFGEKPKRVGSGYVLSLGYGSRIQPLLSINSVSKEVFAISITENDAIVGFKAKFGQPDDLLFESGVNYHLPVSSASESGEFTLKSASAIEVSFAVKKSLGDSYILNGFVNVISSQSSFDYTETPTSTTITGSKSFLVTDIGGSVGFSF